MDWQTKYYAMVERAAKDAAIEALQNANRGTFESLELWYRPSPSGALMLTTDDLLSPWVNTGVSVSCGIPVDRYAGIIQRASGRLPILD